MIMLGTIINSVAIVAAGFLGNITGKYVLYNGESGIVIEGCEYRNVGEYLKRL